MAQYNDLFGFERFAQAQNLARQWDRQREQDAYAQQQNALRNALAQQETQRTGATQNALRDFGGNAGYLAQFGDDPMMYNEILGTMKGEALRTNPKADAATILGLGKEREAQKPSEIAKYQERKRPMKGGMVQHEYRDETTGGKWAPLGEPAPMYAPQRDSGAGGAVPDNMVEALTKQVIEGRLDPAMISKRGGLQQSVFSRVEEIAPGFDLVGANANARYTTNTSNLQSRALMEGVTPLYDKLIETGAALGNTTIPGYNRIMNFAKEQTGDPRIVAFNNLRDDVIAESERVLLGSGVLSDSKYLRAVKNVNSAQSFPQLKAAVDQMRLAVEARLHALDTKPVNTSRMVKKDGPQKTQETDLKNLSDEDLLKGF